MNYPEPNITVNVDATNPGQFFACCGLLELADRLWPGAEGWFAASDTQFCLTTDEQHANLIEAVAQAELIHVDQEDNYSSPVALGGPFGDFVIDWWKTDQAGAKDLKVWAGTMESYGIAHSLQIAMQDEQFSSSGLFDIGMVVRDADNPKKKKEPYYFDARRAQNAHSRDVGFSPNDLKLTTTAYPAVELFCLIGLQVARPKPTHESRVYEYSTWHLPILSSLVLPASTGQLNVPANQYRFENWFRTGQKKHKAFRSAISLT